MLTAFLALAPFVAQDPASAPPRRLLVVAPDRFHAALVPFLRHKRRDLPAELVSLEQALRRSPGADDPERLKRYLFDAWRARTVGYVLLVGDADILPVRYMVLDRVTPAAFDYAFYPSDLYYADLAKPDGTFEDWNAARDDFHAGYFGEVRGEKNKSDPINYDGIDYRPDVAVGRWPVSTAAEVRLVAEKTMRYENGTAVRRAGFLSVGGWTDSRDLMDRLAGRLPRGWTAEKRYYDTDTPPTEEEVVRLLNDGGGLLAHAGHGGDTVWAECFSVDSLARVRNADRLAILISAGCSTARFATLPPYEAYVDVRGRAHRGTNDGEVFEEPPPPPACYQRGEHNPTGLGEQLLRAGPDGAVAYIGCNTGSQPCGLTLLEGLVTALGESDAPRLGDLWSRAVAFYFERENLAGLTPNDDWYPPSIFFQGMKFMLFGDPSLRMPPPVPE